MLSRVARSVSTTGSLWWLSAVARPCPGRCLSTGRTPPAISPCGDRAGDGGDFARRAAVGAVADDRIAAGDRHVRDRQAVDVDAQSRKIVAIKCPASRAAASPSRFPVVEFAVARARRDSPANAAAPAAARGRPPDRPAQALRQPTIVAKRLNKFHYLMGVLTFLLKMMSAPGLGLAEKARSSAETVAPPTR